MNLISERIKAVRKENKLNQQEFANILGLSQTHISKIENGKDNPSDKVLRIISVEFRVSFDWLKAGTGDMYDLSRGTSRNLRLKDCTLPLKEYTQSCSNMELLFSARHFSSLPKFFQSANYMTLLQDGENKRLNLLIQMDAMLIAVTEYVTCLNEEYEQILSSEKSDDDLQEKIQELHSIKDRFKGKLNDSVENFFDCLIKSKDG